MKKRFYTLLILCLLFASSFSSMAQVVNHCLRLSENGSVNCGPMPELDGLTDFTVQFWFCADEWTEGATLLSRGEGFNVKLGTTNTLIVNVRGIEIKAKRTTLTTGVWIPIMIISRPTRVQVYIDNTSIRTGYTSSPMPEESSPFIIGGDSYLGRIDEIRIWSTELCSDYDYFTHTTLNKWVPKLNDLVAYFKFDQPWCENIVDYKALFSSHSRYNHHGILSTTGALREEVTDNQKGLPYLLMGGYTNNERFFDRGIEVDKYLLSNDLIILGLQSYSDGHVRPRTPNDHATVHNGEYLDSYKNKNRTGVLSLNGNNSYLVCPAAVFTPTDGYTIETWIYLEEWTEGAYLFRKENALGTSGFSVRLGTASDRQLIIRVNGREYFYKNTLQKGVWKHIAITPGVGGTNRLTFNVNIGGRNFTADASLSDASTDPMPTGADNLKLYIGQNLHAKLDETMIWHKTFSDEEIENHRNGVIPMPGPGRTVSNSEMAVAMAYYRYNDADNLGWDSYSQDEWRRIMAACYNGYSGFQIRISVQGHTDWQTTIADANKRKIFAADLAELSLPYDGVELDLEWMDGTQTNLGLLADEIRAVLPPGKTFMISHHQYGAYKFPLGKIGEVDGFTFQQYGGQKTWYSYQSFVNGYNAFSNYGYPNDKIYMSYGTTTSSGFNDDESWGRAIIGYNWGIINDGYVPATDGSAERGEWGGYHFYFCGPVQVYNRAKFVREKGLLGLFYWDICNDLSPSHPYSLSRNANYALCANVDPHVETVTVNHPVPTSIGTLQTESTNNQDSNGNNATYDLYGRRVTDAQTSHGIYIINGQKVIK